MVDVADSAVGLSGVADFLDRAVESGRPLAQVLQQRLASGGVARGALAPLLEGQSVNGAVLAMPITPREAWGCGVTYKRSAEFRDADASKGTVGIYDYVYHADRPETFYKGNAAHCVGPFQPICI